MYKKMYLVLFNAITDTLQENDVDKIKEILKQAQLSAEKICLDSEEDI